MEINEIKKLLYKTNPLAILYKIQEGIAYYSAYTIEIERNSSGKEEDWVPMGINFQVPIIDMGHTSFYSKMPAKLLIRWIVKKED